MNDEMLYDEQVRRAFFKDKYNLTQCTLSESNLITEIIELEKAYHLTLDHSKYATAKFDFVLSKLPSVEEVKELIRVARSPEREKQLKSLLKIVTAQEDQCHREPKHT